MPNRRPTYHGPRLIAWLGKTKVPIRIPQPPERPVKLHKRDLVKRDLISAMPWWMTVHRRGLREPKVGEDPQEQRAVPKWQVRGTLPERIVYKGLVDRHFIPNVDFDFQSSLQGGRLVLGGIVADFMVFKRHMIIQVQGPTHGGFLRNRKDEEQTEALAAMGYSVVQIDESECLSESRFEAWMSRYIDRDTPPDLSPDSEDENA